LGGNEERYAVEAIRSSWISSTGTFLDRFEREFAAACGARHALAVSNGTVALHLALLGLGVGPGDEVLVPSLTYVATANAVRYVGAEPTFVDVREDTWCIDPARLAAHLTPRTVGIIAVDLYGHPADMDAINGFAAEHGLWVVEDAAEAHFARYKERPVGSLARISTFSFYGNKILTSGEGGAVTLDDDALAARLKLIRGQGMDPQRRYFFPITGHNFRLTNVAAALLCAQLERAPEILAARRRVFEWYRSHLGGIPGIGLQPVAPEVEAAPWLFCITVDPVAYGRTRDELAALLAADGIDTRPFFVPLHTLPPFLDRAPRAGGALPVTESLAARGLNLPTYGALGEGDVACIAGRVAAHRGCAGTTP
jgi:perosamine synthetase